MGLLDYGVNTGEEILHFEYLNNKTFEWVCPRKLLPLNISISKVRPERVR